MEIIPEEWIVRYYHDPLHGDGNCPFCGHYPYEMVDVGIGMVPVAVNCCEWGYMLMGMGPYGKDSLPFDVVARHQAGTFDPPGAGGE